MQFDYNLWKWRALYRRRLFFFCVLQLVLILNWLTIRMISHHTQSWVKSGTSSTGYRKFYEDLPILFYISHGLLLAIVLFTRVGRYIVHESQGKRLCDWSAFSLILALIFLLVPLNDLRNEGLEASRDVCFATLSLFGIALFQHLGVSEPILSITIACVFALWIVFLSSVELSAATITSVVVIAVSFVVLSRMQEYEFHRTFEKQKDILQGGTYGGSSGGGSALQGGYGFEAFNISMAGVGFGGSMAVFLEDTMIALKAMESTITLQEELLNRDDLLMECEFKMLHSDTHDPDLGNSGDDADQDVVTDILAPVSASAASGNDTEVVAWKLTSHAASLQVNKMLCQALYQAVAHGDDNARHVGSTFSFNKICHQLFALFEGVCGSSLTLYANETVSEVLISAPRSIFELIIFLLLHDAVNAEERRICCMSCETSAVHGWHISIQSLSLERHRDRYDASNSTSVNTTVPSNEGLRKVKSGSNKNAASSVQPFNLGKNLLLNENVNKRNRPMERIAERLTMKHLKSTIQHSDPEYRAGVRVEHKIIPLTSDRCMLAPTHASLTFARWHAAGSQKPPRSSQIPQENRKRTNSKEDAEVVMNAVTSPTKIQQQSQPPQLEEDVDPQQPPLVAQQAPSVVQNNQQARADQDFQQWLFVVQRSHDLEGMGEIKEKMKSLCVPCRVKALSELRDPSYSASPMPFSVMLIDETFLAKLLKDKDKSKFKFLRGMHLKWVVVSDPKKLSTSTDIKVLYGIDADSLSAKSSIAEVFECIQLVTQKLPPRTPPDVNTYFDDFDDHESQRLRSQDSNSGPSFNFPQRRIGARGLDRSEVEAVRRWLLLVRQFKAVASRLAPADGVLLNGLDARMKDIESLRDVHDNLEGLMSMPSYGGALADMNTHKKKAKFILDTYQPMLERLRTNLDKFDLASLQSLAAKSAVRSSTLGLLHLSAWFTTLQEIVSITMNILETRDVARVGDSGFEKSVSFSFTSAGKALAARSAPSKGSAMNASGATSIAATAAFADATGRSVGNGVGIAAINASDHLAVQDISEQDVSGFPDDSDKLTELPRSFPSATAGVVDALASAESVNKNNGATGLGADSISATAPQFKAVDAGLKRVIVDMVKAIEVAVWDAAMER